jgi:hypothetical protein
MVPKLLKHHVVQGHGCMANDYAFDAVLLQTKILQRIPHAWLRNSIMEADLNE